jgi:tetratricopeptide (TPR) repeat protein
MTEYTDDNLPDEIYEKITDLSEQGNTLLDAGDINGAIAAWEEALATVPSPNTEWESALWLHASLGEAHRMAGRFDIAQGHLLDALNCPDGHMNPFVLLRLGETLVDQGQPDPGTEYLLRAYMLEGDEIFEEDDDKPYFQILRDRGLVD